MRHLKKKHLLILSYVPFTSSGAESRLKGYLKEMKTDGRRKG